MTRSLALLSLVAILSCQPALCDDSTVLTQITHAKVSGVAISATTGKVAKAAGSSDTVTDGIYVGHSRDFSVGVTIVATDTVSNVVTVQGSWDGSNYYGFDTAVTVTSAANGGKIKLVTLPPCDWVRFSLAADASLPTTYSGLVLIQK
jgi:hypothetical protein